MPVFLAFQNTDIQGLNDNLLLALSGGIPGTGLATEATLIQVRDYLVNGGNSVADLLTVIYSNTANIESYTNLANTITSQIETAIESGSSYINNSNFVKGFAKNILNTTATDVLVAPGASNYNYITHILVTNGHAAVSTIVDIVDETSGDVLYTGFAASGGGGYSVTLPTPVRQNTTNKKVQAKCLTNGADVTVSISGYKAL